MNFEPTYLMIKRHTTTGLKYFCKTSRRDPYKYLGSGKYWKRHLKVHGRQFVVTDWVSELFTDMDDLVEFALFFSEVNNIVESSRWANTVPENGLDGGDRYQGRGWREISTSEVYESRVKTAIKNNLERAEDPEFISYLSQRVKETQWDTPEGDLRKANLSKKMGGADNHQSKTYKIVTPVGSFVIKSLKTFCRERGLVYDTVRRHVGQGKIQRTGPKDTSFSYSKTKQSIEGWEIIEITKE